MNGEKQSGDCRSGGRGKRREWEREEGWAVPPIWSQLNNLERFSVSRLEIFQWKLPWPEAASSICGANQNNHYDRVTSFLSHLIPRYFGI